MPLILNNKKIDRISGPVSCYILIPKTEFVSSMEKIGLNAPAFILFGDRHESSEFRCSNCSCASEMSDTKSCCFRAFDPKFLKLLDDIATPTLPIDFYVETFFHLVDPSRDIHSEKRPCSELYPTIKWPDCNPYYADQLIPMLRDGMQSCYVRDKKVSSKYNWDPCPTNNIRWQSSDLRQTFFQKPWVFEGMYSWFFQPLMDNIVKNMFNNPWYLDHWFHSFAKRDVPISTLIEFLEAYKYYFQNDWIKFFELLFDTSSLVNQHSLIAKQLRKYTDKTFLIQMKQWFIGYLATFYTYDAEGKMITNYSPLVLKLIETCIDGFKEINKSTTRNQRKEAFLNFKNNLVLLGNGDFYYFYERRKFPIYTAKFLDLYMLARAFKKPTNGQNPALVFTAFGAAHALFLKNFFMEVMQQYNLLFEQLSTPILNPKLIQPDRCISFPKDVDINLDYLFAPKTSPSRTKRSIRLKGSLKRQASPIYEYSRSSKRILGKAATQQSLMDFRKRFESQRKKSRHQSLRSKSKKKNK
jgi:hypothetical protein